MTLDHFVNNEKTNSQENNKLFFDLQSSTFLSTKISDFH